MKKKELIQKLSYKFPEIEKEDIKYILDSFFDLMKRALLNENRIEIRGFGVLYLTKGKGVFFTNPKNQQRYYIKEKIRPVFKLGKEFKERLNLPFLASLDLGTQTFRLCLGKHYKGKTYYLLNIRENVRLGEGLVNNKKISEKAFQRGIEALKNFKKIMDTYEVRKYKAVGTAVFREAKNASEFIEKAKKEAGININVISWEEEARLTLKGIKAGLKEAFPEIDDFIAIDVGGGSSEIAYIEKNEIKWIKSIKLGAVLLKEIFNLRYPLSSKILTSLRNYIQEKIKNLPKIMPKIIVITGGTASILGSLDLKLTQYIPELLHTHRITLERLEKLINRLSNLPIPRLSKVKGMERGREDIVIPGMLIYSEILKYFNKSELIISEYGILEATLLSLIEDYNF